MQPFNVFLSPASLPPSTTWSLVFIFTIIQTSHCRINTSLGHCCCWLKTSKKTPWKGPFFFACNGLIWNKFLLRSSFWQTRTSSRKLEAKLDRALGAAAGPAVQWFSTGPLPPKLNYSAQPSLVQHSCRSNIFGNSHYFRNECSCVFIAIACLLYQQLKRLGCSRHRPLIRTRWKTVYRMLPCGQGFILSE